MPNSIKTYSKIKINPLNPNPDLILIDDIAHSLSLMCRANGHVSEFFSVAQHSICCAEEAIARGYSNRIALALLLHDGSEAYLADITRPVKKSLTFYLEVEDKLQNTIYKKYLGSDLTKEESEKLGIVDDAILYHELLVFMDEKLDFKDTDLKSKPNFSFEPFKEVEDRFKELFNELTNKLNA
ncbi:MAG: phosphohydrolase [Sarcina sp.]|uniref:phosphohydrolase n=1 Tax=Clostridium sp. TaxID=1506 RepID=UPI003F41199E